MEVTMAARQPLKPVMLVRPPLAMLDDQGFWDELKDAGIDTIAIQWLALQETSAAGGGAPKIVKDEDHHERALKAAGGREARAMPAGAFRPSAKLFEGMKVWSPPEMPDSVKDQAQRLKSSLERAKSRGFTLWCMDDKGYFRIGGTGTGRPAPAAVSVCDPETSVYTGARVADEAANFPMFSAVVLDGPDFKWDIKPGSRDDIAVENFDDPHQRKFAQSIGLSVERVTEGRDRFVARLKSLKPAVVDDIVANQSRGGSAWHWWTEDTAVADWLRYRHAVVEWSLRATVGEIRKRAPQLKVGTSSRVPAMTIMNGHNLRRERTFTDFQLPKEYWWLAVAGIRGTIQNWVSTIVDWNAGMSEEQACRWFSAAFDIALPADYPPSAYGQEATKSWYETTVRDQTRKMISSVGGVDRFVPFVGLEHFNLGWMPASELRGVLAEMQSQGAKRYCFYTYNSMTPDVWKVITDFSRG